MSEQPTTQEEMKNVTMVCVAVEAMADGKQGYDLRLVSDAGEIVPGGHWFAAKAIKKAHIYIGGMYSVPINAERNRATLASAQYLGQWPNDAERTEWKAKERAFEIGQRAKKQLLEDKADNPMVAALEPIRSAWQKTDTVGRLAIEVQVLAYLRGATKYIKMENP